MVHSCVRLAMFPAYLGHHRNVRVATVQELENYLLNSVNNSAEDDADEDENGE
jgi:hypothetical protein